MEYVTSKRKCRNGESMKKIKYFILLLVLVGLDQITKLWAKSSFMDGDSLTLIPNTLKFVYHENDGAAWGMFSGKTFFLCALTFVMVLFFLYFFFKVPNTKRMLPIKILTVCVMAGAIGNNLIDRIVYGHVIDFIYFELINFPVFNVADMYITVSVAIFFILSIFYYEENDFDFILKHKNKTGNDEEDENGK